MFAIQEQIKNNIFFFQKQINTIQKSPQKSILIMLDKAKNYFLEKGLTLIDIPKAALIHETIGLSILFGIWAGCYIFRPSHRLLVPLRRRYPHLFTKKSGNMDLKLHKLKEKLKKFKKIDGERVVISLGESVVLRNLIRPFTIPFKLWATWKIIILLKNPQNPPEN